MTGNRGREEHRGPTPRAAARREISYVHTIAETLRESPPVHASAAPPRRRRIPSPVRGCSTSCGRGRGSIARAGSRRTRRWRARCHGGVDSRPSRCIVESRAAWKKAIFEAETTPFLRVPRCVRRHSPTLQAARPMPSRNLLRLRTWLLTACLTSSLMSVQRQENRGLNVMQAHPAAAFTATASTLPCAGTERPTAPSSTRRGFVPPPFGALPRAKRKKGNNGDW